MPLYTITNKDSDSAGHGRVYIGSCSITLSRRMARHYYLGDHATEASPAMYRDMRETLKRARSTSEWSRSTTTDILRRYYPAQATEVAQADSLTSPIDGDRESLRTSEQDLLDATKRLTLLPCYNTRRPVSKRDSKEKRESVKAAYHATKTLCSCGRMVSKGNVAHAKTAVHTSKGLASV